MRARGVDALFAARRRWAWIRRLLGLAAAVVLLAVVYVAVGLIPVNRGFVPTPGGVEVSLISSAVHADVIVPIAPRNSEVSTTDWRAWLGDDVFAAGWPAGATHLAIGWGDRGFFLNTPEWTDLRPGTAAKALLWPSATCMHVTLTRPDLYDPATIRSVTLSSEQHARLVRFLRNSFVVDQGGHPTRMQSAAYGDYDAFFDAAGRYHAARNCNNWVGSALRAAGVTVPWYTPIPRTAFLYLP